MGGSKKTTTTNQRRDPWEPAQGNLRDVLARSGALAGDLNNFRPQISGTYNNALDRLEQLSQQPNQLTEFLRPVVEQSGENFGIGQNTLRQTARGDLIGQNPFLDDLIKRQQQNTASLVNSQFSGAGRYGSGAHTGTLTDRLGGLELQARHQNYENERGRQLGAASGLFDQGFRGTQLSGLLDQSELADANLGLEVGGIRNAIADANNQAGLRATEWLGGITNPIARLGFDGTATTTQETSPNPVGQVVSGLSAGLGFLAGGPAGGGLMAGLSGMGGGGGLTGFQQGYAGMHSPSFWPATIGYG